MTELKYTFKIDLEVNFVLNNMHSSIVLTISLN